MEYTGIIGSRGIVIGKAYLCQNEKADIDTGTIKEQNIEEELNKVREAMRLSEDQIYKIMEQAAREIGQKEADIFQAHLMILGDPELIGGIEALIRSERIHAPYATSRVIENYISLFSNMEDEYLKERAADLKDVGNRLLKNLLGIAGHDISKLSSDVILVAHDLTPSDTALMDKEHVKGFLTEIGGETSHTAIMARVLEIPAVLGLGGITEKIQDGQTVIIDGNAGKVIVNPCEDDFVKYRREMGKYNQYINELKNIAKLPSMTLEGKTVELFGNIGGMAEVDSVLAYGGEGIGLYRTEFLYMDRNDFPDEEEQYQAYRAVAEKMQGRPVIIRTLDIGGDKKLPYLPLQEEMNPFLGLRAIRLCFEMKEMFKTQLRAILRASASNSILVMFPMISGTEEVIQAKQILTEAKDELREKGISFDENIKCGVMIEIPSAALAADLIIKEADFFSIGTNDLCQYTLAVDRMNMKISRLYQPFHPAVLRLIKNVIDESHKAGKVTGMCGEMAGDPAAALLLLGLGLDEFSMNASALPVVKKMIRSITMEEAKKIAGHAMTLESASQIQAYCEEMLKRFGTINEEDERCIQKR